MQCSSRHASPTSQPLTVNKSVGYCLLWMCTLAPPGRVLLLPNLTCSYPYLTHFNEPQTRKRNWLWKSCCAEVQKSTSQWFKKSALKLSIRALCTYRSMEKREIAFWANKRRAVVLLSHAFEKITAKTSETSCMILENCFIFHSEGYYLDAAPGVTRPSKLN